MTERDPKVGLMEAMLEAMPKTDFREAESAEITIAQTSEGIQLWVDIDGMNRLRAYRVKTLVVDDRRKVVVEV